MDERPSVLLVDDKPENLLALRAVLEPLDMNMVDAGSGDEAQASEVLESSLEGEDIAIAFNPMYPLDGLGALDTSHARLAFTTSTKPAVITRADAEGGVQADYRHLLMPVRLSG